MATGFAVYAILFFTAKTAKAIKAAQMAKRDKIGAYLDQSRDLLKRARKAGSGDDFSDEVQTWANELMVYIEKEFGPSYVSQLQHSDRGWRYSDGPEASPTTPWLENVNSQLGSLLKSLP